MNSQLNRNITEEYVKFFSSMDNKQRYNWNRKRIRATIRAVRTTTCASATINWLTNLQYLLRQRSRLQWRVINNE